MAKASLRIERDYAGEELGHVVTLVYVKADEGGEIRQEVDYDDSPLNATLVHAGFKGLHHEQVAEPGPKQMADGLRALADKIEAG
jgi:hypothetical protein